MKTRQIQCGIGQASLMLLLAVGFSNCGAHTSKAGLFRTKADILDEINALRAKSGLSALVSSDILAATAETRAAVSAEQGKIEADENRLPTLTAAGAYARFALSHAVNAASFSEAENAILTDSLSKSKILHPALTHVGIGYKKKKGQVYLACDYARLVPTITDKDATTTVQQKLDEKRIRNSLELLAINDNLSTAAKNAAAKFMSSDVSSDEILSETQTNLKNETFAFGRMTVSFQAASDLNQVIIPERAGDPSLAFAGIGAAQGNRAEHEAGAVVVVLILAEPQTAHNSTRTFSDLPAPKAQLRSKIATDKPLADQAWTATLTGNHARAATLFEKAYKQTKKPMLMYEAARAHARNDNIPAARKDMRLYANMTQGEENQKAQDMLTKLEKGESIFSASTAEQMSVEAKRFFVMGQLLFGQKEWDGAVDAFQQAYRFSPTPEIVYNIGLAHYRAGRIGEALNFFGEYQRLAPGAANVEEARQFFEIGIELYKSGRFDAASLQFAMAYSFLPFPELVYNLGLCYKAMGEKENAIRFFREYLENELIDEDREAVRQLVRELSTGNK